MSTAPHDPPAAWPARRAKPSFVVLVALLHLALLLWWLYGPAPPGVRRASAPTRVNVRLIPWRVLPTPATQVTRSAALRTPVPSRLPTEPPRVSLPSRAPVIVPEAITVPAPVAAPEAVAEAAPPTASAPPLATGPISDDMIRRGVHAAEGQHSLARQAREQIGDRRLTPDQKLAQGVAAAGRPDCLNPSSTPGAQGNSTANAAPIPVGGLLALPFLLVNAATGKCRP